MRNNLRSLMPLLALILALLVSAIGSYSVYADDGEPPESPGAM